MPNSARILPSHGRRGIATFARSENSDGAVTGLTLQDFRLLVGLRVFNTERMNQAVFAFRRYEDASLVGPGGRWKVESTNHKTGGYGRSTLGACPRMLPESGALP